MKIFCLVCISFFCLLSLAYGTDSDVVITWEAPLVNVNGTKCVDYLGVRIYQRMNDEPYDFNNPIAIIYDDLYWAKSDFYKEGIYHWVLQSFDTSNNICPDYTEEVTKTIKITMPFTPKKLTCY